VSKRNEAIQQAAEQYWKQLEAGGMAHEFCAKTLVVGSYRDGVRAAEKAFRAELRDLVKAHNKTVHELTHQIAGYKLRAEIDQRSMKLISRAAVQAVSGGAA
jgi:hypothetical protein